MKPSPPTWPPLPDGAPCGPPTMPHISEQWSIPTSPYQIHYLVWHTRRDTLCIVTCDNGARSVGLQGYGCRVTAVHVLEEIV